jgi:hypothetical protein
MFANNVAKIHILVSPCLSAIITPMMEAVCSSETSVSIYQTTRCNIPEDRNLLINILKLKSLLHLAYYKAMYKD